MTPNSKIAIALVGWVVATAAMLFLVMPKLGGDILEIQRSKATEYAELEKLRATTRELQRLQEDLDAINQQPVGPEDFFTHDETLVREIQHVEKLAQETGNEIKIDISGTADKALQIQSSSTLFQVPYTVTLKGRFDNLVRFMDLMENSYFVSPVSGFNIAINPAATDSTITTSIFSSFFIHKK